MKKTTLEVVIIPRWKFSPLICLGYVDFVFRREDCIIPIVLSTTSTKRTHKENTKSRLTKPTRANTNDRFTSDSDDSSWGNEYSSKSLCKFWMNSGRGETGCKLDCKIDSTSIKSRWILFGFNRLKIDIVPHHLCYSISNNTDRSRPQIRCNTNRKIGYKRFVDIQGFLDLFQ
jgi:hypothetical protein